MTHYLLNYLDVCFIFAKRMAKNAATEIRDDNGFSVFFLNPLTLTGNWITSTIILTVLQIIQLLTGKQKKIKIPSKFVIKKGVSQRGFYLHCAV